MGIQLNGITGDAIIPGDVGIGGTLTYEDVTNVDSVGVITARDGIRCTGICTATSFHGDGSQLTGISVDTTKIETGNTKVETIDTGSDGHVKVTTEGTERLRITSDGDVAITTRGSVEGVSKLNVEIPSRTTAFSASDGDTWHDVLIENPGAATTNAVGLCFQVTGDPYHKNAGTGIAAVKNGTNSDYGSDLVFITRPQSAVASERLRIDSYGHVTKPSQAMFSAAGSGNAWVIFNSGSGWYNLGDSSFDGSSYYRDHGWTTTGRPGVGVRGVTSSGASVWDNAKGRFTAPVNGFYFFEINLYIRAYSGGHTFHVNPWIGSTNTDYYTSNIGIIRNSSNSVTGNTQQYPNSVMRSIVLYLTANQQFRWSIYAENDRFESYKSQAHQSGYLIG